MNKYLVLLLLPLLFCYQTSQSQAVAGKSIEASFSLGFGLYGVGNNIDEDVNSIALPGLMNLKAQYAIAKWFSLGLMYERNGYLTDPDSSENAKSNNFYLDFTFRFLNKEKTAIYSMLDLGLGSNYSYEQEISKDKVSSKGSAFQLGFGIKHFISDHIGIGYEMAMAAYSYDELKNDDGDVWEFYDIEDNENKNVILDLAGINHRIGITYKF